VCNETVADNWVTHQNFNCYCRKYSLGIFIRFSKYRLEGCERIPKPGNVAMKSTHKKMNELCKMMQIRIIKYVLHLKLTINQLIRKFGLFSGYMALELLNKGTISSPEKGHTLLFFDLMTGSYSSIACDVDPESFAA